MLSPLATRRQSPPITPAKFLAAQPGCWIQYYDDTAAKDPAKALSARTFDLDTARRKQCERCAVGFSLQAFGTSRTKEGFLCFRNLGVDIDLLTAAERRSLSAAEIDRRKDDYLVKRFLPFPLKAHWLIETRHGFHAIFRVQPQRSEAGVREAGALNHRLVSLLGGDANAVLLTQVLRVPCTLQFKGPSPFLCRLLSDNAASIPPYDLTTVRSVLDAWEVFHGTGRRDEPAPAPPNAAEGGQPPRRQLELDGVPEGRRNATAASIVGAILGRLPEHLWETAGWGGLKEWNQKNAVRLPERELRSVFASIARRERTGRQREGRGGVKEGSADVLVRVDVRIEGGGAALPFKIERVQTTPGTAGFGGGLPTSSYGR